MDPAERLRKLYESLPLGSAFRKAIEQALQLATDITGLPFAPKEKADPAAPAAEASPPES